MAEEKKQQPQQPPLEKAENQKRIDESHFSRRPPQSYRPVDGVPERPPKKDDKKEGK